MKKKQTGGGVGGKNFYPWNTAADGARSKLFIILTASCPEQHT